MKLALWILVALLGFGVALYAGELYRQSLERRAAAQAIEESMKEARAASEKAAVLAEWQRKTDETIKSEETSYRHLCSSDSTVRASEDSCKMIRAVMWECNAVSDNLKKGIIPKEECLISASERHAW
ncbi:MAG: hypothetical protein WBQ74_04440 [Candidatus Sulfotelmatobacter sp.]|jgi:uncharacterized protein HemX